MYFDDVSDILDDMHEIANPEQGKIEYNVVTAFRHFYNRHKKTHGSNAPYLGTPEYEKRMYERYDWTLCKINEDIEMQRKIKTNTGWRK